VARKLRGSLVLRGGVVMELVPLPLRLSRGLQCMHPAWQVSSNANVEAWAAVH